MPDQKRCRERSRAAGQPLPCRESRVSPGTCVWCFRRIDEPDPAVVEGFRRILDATGETREQRLAKVTAALESEPPIHPSDLRGLRFRP